VQRQRNNSDDVASFEAVVAATRATCLYWNPWSAPTPLRRVWCLYEILCTIKVAHPLYFALSPGDLREMRAEPAKLRFGIENLRSMDADATMDHDWYRIHIMIEEELHPDIPAGKRFPRDSEGRPLAQTALMGPAEDAMSVILSFLPEKRLCAGSAAGKPDVRAPSMRCVCVCLCVVCVSR